MNEGEQTIEEQPARDAHPSTPGATAGVGPDGDGGPGVDAPADGADPAFVDAREAELARHDDEDAGEVEGDLDELVRTAAERDEYLALAQRTQADFENYRKRGARESALAQERGASALAKELLPALDNLDRALDAAAKDDPLLD